MNPPQSRALVTESFPQPFDKGRFRRFSVNLLNHLDESKAQAWNPEADVSALEREIDPLVYALYGLTPEEIKTVEGAGK